MQAYQRRVMEEKAELDKKWEALRRFIRSDEFQKLPEAERWRLTLQGTTMADYSAILDERIAAFEVKAPRPAPEAAMTASEALYGFMAWLTSRKGSVVLGADHDSGDAVRLMQEWMDGNGLPEPRDGKILNVVQPRGAENMVGDRYWGCSTIEGPSQEVPGEDCGVGPVGPTPGPAPDFEVSKVEDLSSLANFQPPADTRLISEEELRNDACCSSDAKTITEAAAEEETAELYSELLQATGDSAIGETRHEAALRHIRCGVMYIRFGGNP